MSSRSDARGFTLVELLVASGVFSVLALLALMIVTIVTKNWSDIRSRTDVYRRLDLVARAITDDLRAVNGDDLGLIGDISFTRFLAYPDENGNHVLALTRSFGLGRERAVYITTDNLPAPDGLAEVAYFVDGGTLYRALRAPADGSFQDIISPSKARAVAPGVLRFSLRFWGPDTAWWELPADITRKVTLLNLPLWIWDSTRGLGGKFDGFLYSAGPDSLTDSADDIFPRMVEVNVVMDGGSARTAVLRKGTGTTDGVLYTSSTAGIPGPEIYPYLYVDGEWVHYMVKNKNSFGVERGAFDSKARVHSAGAKVRWGYPAAFRVYVPAGKDAFDTGPAARGGRR